VRYGQFAPGVNTSPLRQTAVELRRTRKDASALPSGAAAQVRTSDDCVLHLCAASALACARALPLQEPVVGSAVGGRMQPTLVGAAKAGGQPAAEPPADIDHWRAW